jgi:hypothetical protein
MSELGFCKIYWIDLIGYHQNQPNPKNHSSDNEIPAFAGMTEDT